MTLDIYQEVSELAEGSTSGLPITNKRSAKTTVVVQDSQTVVIGGLIKDSINKVREKVPILGDIPLLGLLFRKTSDVVEKINLMIFITPHIIHTPMDQQTITIKQNEKRRQFNKYHKVDEHPGVKGYGLDKSVDFNSVRPPKTKPSPVERETEPPAPLRESDVQNEGIEVDDSDSGPVSRSRKQMSTDDMTQVRMKQPAKKTYDDSFFKEERTAQDFYDSDYISEDLLYQMPDEDTPKPKKRKTPSGNSNPFDEVDPPSSQ